MRLLRMGPRWTALYIVSALPGMLGFAVMVLLAAGGITWTQQAGGGNFGLLFLLFAPFYLALFVGAVVLQVRDRDSDPPQPSPLRVPWPAWVIGFVFGVSVLAYGLSEIEETSPVEQRDRTATGCRNDPRFDSRPVTANYHIVVFDRFCESSPRHTVNVSILAAATELEGQGNVFIAEPDDPSVDVSQRLSVFAFPPAPGRGFEILYDPRAHVLMRVPEWNGMPIVFAQDTLSRR